MLVDGFRAAEILKEKDPEAYNLLSRTVTQFRDIGKDYREFNKLNSSTFIV